MCLNHLPSPNPLVFQVHQESAVSGVLCISSGELISGCDPSADVNCSGSQEDLVSNWEPARSLVEDAVSGDEFAPLPLVLAVTHLPPCIQRGVGLFTAG